MINKIKTVTRPQAKALLMMYEETRYCITAEQADVQYNTMLSLLRKGFINKIGRHRFDNQRKQRFTLSLTGIWYIENKLD